MFNLTVLHLILCLYVIMQAAHALLLLNINVLLVKILNMVLREALVEKNGKKGDIVPFWRPPP